MLSVQAPAQNAQIVPPTHILQLLARRICQHAPTALSAQALEAPRARHLSLPANANMDMILLEGNIVHSQHATGFVSCMIVLIRGSSSLILVNMVPAGFDMWLGCCALLIGPVL